MKGDELAHFRKFASFVLGKDRAFFNALQGAIEEAHTYILADAASGDPNLAVLMGRPLALVRAELRLELAGLPAFDSSSDAVAAAMTANGGGAYDWTLRDDAALREVDFPVRLGDRDHLADGLIGYFVEGSDPYDTFYAPAATQTDGTGVRHPDPDTLRLNLRASLDPPAAPFADSTAQVAALTDVSVRSAGIPLTLLIDPRASVHATTGVLPVKSIDLPDQTYAQALRSIEAAFFTHPILRGTQGLELPIPDEAGFDWHWAMTVKDGPKSPTHARQEKLPLSQTGDRAHFSFSRQVAQDGWLKLVPKPASPGSQGANG
jgi:hypothetical protein